MTRIVYLSWPSREMTGGIKMVFHHVEALGDAGFHACVATADGAGPHWFESDAPVTRFDDLARGRDVLVFPENHVALLRQFADWPNRKAVFCQNQFMVHRGLDGVRDYTDYGVQALICPGQQVAAFCRRRSAVRDLFVVPYPIDTTLFHPRDPKRMQIAFMPRKRPQEAAFIRDLFRAENPGWRSLPWVPMVGLAERQVARVLGASALFLSLCRFEAVPLSLLEALASGCIAAGFTGFGGNDYATARNGFWAPEDDVLACVHQLTLAAHLVAEGGSRYADVREAAVQTAAGYSRAKFLARLGACWTALAPDAHRDYLEVPAGRGGGST